MRKIFAASLLSLACLALVLFLRNAPPETVEELPQEVLDYRKLFNEKADAFLPTEKVDAMDKYDRPDMFFEFDKLQRMDPKTGEVPENGLRNALDNLKQQFPGFDDYSSTAKTNKGIQWDERGPSSIGGRTRALMWDPNDANNRVVFAGGVGGGLWRTPDITVANPSWSQVMPTYANVALTCIAYDPSNTQIMYYGTGEGWNNADSQRGAGIWKSTDGGLTWNVLPATENGSFFYNQKIVVTDAGIVYAATKGGLFRSTDQGASFTKVLGTQAGAGSDWITDIEISGDGDLYAGSRGSGLYYSPTSLGNNQGTLNNWTRQSVPFPGSYTRIEIAAGQSSPNTIYVLCAVGSLTGGVFKTTDGGSNWSATTGQPNGGSDFSNGQAWYDLCIEVDPQNANIVYLGAIDYFRTTNGGTSWARRTAAYGGFQPYMHPDMHGIFFRPGNSAHIAFTNDGGIWYTTNGSNSYSTKNSGYNVTQFYSISIDPKAGSNRILGGTQDNGTILTAVPGIGPGDLVSGGDGSYCAFNHEDPDTFYTTSQYTTVRRTRNGGVSFNSLTNQNLGQSDVLFINPLEIDVNNPNILYQASTSLWRHNSASSGSWGGWVQATANLGSRITAIGISKNIANLVYVASGGVVYRIPSANTGNFTVQPPTVNPGDMGSGYINCIAVDPNDGNHIVVSFASFGLNRRVVETRNADAGAAAVWKDLTGNLPDLPVNWAVFEPNNNEGVLIGTDLGAFRCSNISLPENDIFWSPEKTGMGNPRVNMLEVRESDNMVFAATHGRGFFSTDSYNAMPTADFGIAQDSVCDGFVAFIDSSEGAPVSWSWTFGDGNTSTAQSPMHQYAASGTYNVTLLISNPNGTDSIAQTISITVVPPAVAVAGTDTIGCPGDTVWLSASGGTNYLWDPAGSVSDPNSANPYYVISGTRTFVVTVTNQFGCEDTDTMVVSQDNPPNVWAGQDQSITAPGDSVQLTGFGGATFLWTPSTGLSCTTCPDPMCFSDTSITYTLTSWNASGCSGSDMVNVNVNIVGIDDPLEQSGLQLGDIVPNPVAQTAFINYSLKERTEVSLDLIDLSGKQIRLLKDGIEAPGDHRVNFDRSGLSSGIYFLRLSSKEGSRVKKIILR